MIASNHISMEIEDLEMHNPFSIPDLYHPSECGGGPVQARPTLLVPSPLPTALYGNPQITENLNTLQPITNDISKKSKKRPRSESLINELERAVLQGQKNGIATSKRDSSMTCRPKIILKAIKKGNWDILRMLMRTNLFPSALDPGHDFLGVEGIDLELYKAARQLSDHIWFSWIHRERIMRDSVQNNWISIIKYVIYSMRAPSPTLRSLFDIATTEAIKMASLRMIKLLFVSALAVKTRIYISKSTCLAIIRASGCPNLPIIRYLLGFARKVCTENGLLACLSESLKGAMSCSIDNLKILVLFGHKILPIPMFRTMILSGMKNAATQGNKEAFTYLKSRLDYRGVAYSLALRESLRLASAQGSFPLVEVIMGEFVDLEYNFTLSIGLIMAIRVASQNNRIDCLAFLVRGALGGLLVQWEIRSALSNAIVLACEAGWETPVDLILDELEKYGNQIDLMDSFRRGYLRACAMGHENLMCLMSRIIGSQNLLFNLEDLKKNLELAIRACHIKSVTSIFKEGSNKENNSFTNQLMNIIEPLIDELCNNAQLKQLFVLLRSACQARFDIQKILEKEAKLAFVLEKSDLLAIMFKEGFNTFEASINHLHSLYEQTDSTILRNQIEYLKNHHLIPNDKREGNLVLILKRAERNGDFDLIRQVMIFLLKQ